MVSIGLNSTCVVSNDFGLKALVCGALAFAQAGNGRTSRVEVLACMEFKSTNILALDLDSAVRRYFRGDQRLLAHVVLTALTTKWADAHNSETWKPENIS